MLQVEAGVTWGLDRIRLVLGGLLTSCGAGYERGGLGTGQD